MLKHDIEDYHTMISSCNFTLVVEKDHLLLVDVYMAIEDLVEEEINLVVVTKKILIQTPIEVLHLETQKIPSSLTY